MAMVPGAEAEYPWSDTSRIILTEYPTAIKEKGLERNLIKTWATFIPGLETTPPEIA